MTDAGLMIYNDQNRIQIDSKYKNLCLDSKSTGKLFRHTLEGIHAFNLENGFFDIRCFANISNECYYATQTDVTDYYFNWNVPAASSGLEVYNSQNERVFSSNSKPLRVLDFVSLDVNSLILGSVCYSKSYNASKIAIIPSQIPYNFRRDRHYILLDSFSFLMSGGSLEVSYKQVMHLYAYKGSSTISAASSASFQPYGNFLVIDISHY